MRRLRFYVEFALALLTLLSAILTLAFRDWIEFAFRVDPDEHNGSIEWLITAALLSIAIGFACVARREWRFAAVAA